MKPVATPKQIWPIVLAATLFTAAVPGDHRLWRCRRVQTDGPVGGRGCERKIRRRPGA